MALTKVSTGVVDMSGNTGGLVIAKGTDAQKPTCTAANLGSIRENTTENKVEVCTSTGWQFLEEVGPTFIPLTVDYLIVAGGGAGSTGNGYMSGGGGAGGLLTNVEGSSLVLDTSNTYNITVGAGGDVLSSSGSIGANGSNSILSGTGITTLTAIGGGRGGAVTSSFDGATGGSGGGGASVTTAGSGGAAVQSGAQGNNGGNGISPGDGRAAGGGGGAGSAGVNASGSDPSQTWVAGNGGNGLTNSITVASGTGPYYAGGGGGGAYFYSGWSFTPGTGGSGVGGNGSQSSNAAGNGATNTGSGGGGSDRGAGGDGGSGIVILRYPSVYAITFQTGVGFISSTATLSATSEKVTTITAGSGTITFA
jgi:hypothetical protein